VAYHCRVENIPPVIIPDTKPGRRGIAYHRQGCEHSDGLGSHPGYLVRGGERWSLSRGKGCPGPKRIAQLDKIIIPRVKAILKPPAPTPLPEVSTVADPPNVTTPLDNFSYVSTLYPTSKGKMSTFQAAEHAAGQAIRAVGAVEGVAEDVAELKVANAGLREQVSDIQATLAAILERLPDIQ
jgi:hypothetical protein